MDQFKKKLVVVLAFTFLFAGELNANPAGSGKDAPAIIADVLAVIDSSIFSGSILKPSLMFFKVI